MEKVRSCISNTNAATSGVTVKIRLCILNTTPASGTERKNDGAQPADPLASDFMKELQRRGIDAEKAQAKVRH